MYRCTETRRTTMEIKRDAYLQQLIERKDNGMIKVITGIRRCGKSFLLFTIFTGEWSWLWSYCWNCIGRYRERGIKRSQDAFLISKASRYDIKGGICMKRNYWALLVFVLIIVLQWIGLGFHGQIRFVFLIIILVLIVLLAILLWK